MKPYDGVLEPVHTKIEDIAQVEGDRESTMAEGAGSGETY